MSDKFNCAHENVLALSAKCSDRAYVVWPNGAESEGYMPDIPGLGGGDYLEMEVCVLCHKVLGMGQPSETLAEQPLADREKALLYAQSNAERAQLRGRLLVHPKTIEAAVICQVCGSPESEPACPACGED